MQWPTEILENETGLVFPAIYHSFLIQLSANSILSVSFLCHQLPSYHTSHLPASIQIWQVASQAIANVYHHWKSQSRLPDTLTLLTDDVHWDFSILKCNGKSFFFFLNCCQLALISQTVSYFKTAGKLFLISLVEVVHSKSMGTPFSLMPLWLWPSTVLPNLY